MYATCPHCLSQFHISAAHLTTADGKVRCGVCSHVFDVVEHIQDKPYFSADKITTKNEKSPLEPTVITPQAPSKTTPKTRDHAPALHENKLQDKNKQSALLNETASPDVFYDQRITTPSLPNNKTPSILWSIGTLLLTLVSLTQLSWFNRDYILQRYPQLQPYVQSFCTQKACTVVRHSDTRLIKLVNRDVRPHPHFVDALLANATMVNKMPHAQAYPTIQLTFFDTDGTIIGSRKFSPQHYLDDSIAIEKGMPVNEKVHFVLEIAEYEKNAVSFEFRFL